MKASVICTMLIFLVFLSGCNQTSVNQPFSGEKTPNLACFDAERPRTFTGQLSPGMHFIKDPNGGFSANGRIIELESETPVEKLRWLNITATWEVPTGGFEEIRIDFPIEQYPGRLMFEGQSPLNVSMKFTNEKPWPSSESLHFEYSVPSNATPLGSVALVEQEIRFETHQTYAC